ncbi:MAG: hypothetical protein AMXMBFR46_11840 [Acidimicrobiia bacterium]
MRDEARPHTGRVRADEREEPPHEAGKTLHRGLGGSLMTCSQMPTATPIEPGKASPVGAGPRRWRGSTLTVEELAADEECVSISAMLVSMLA